MNIEAIVKATSGALTPLVAVLALYIAYRQYRVEHHTAKIELFDRRFDIYQRVLKYVIARCQSDTIPQDVNREFHAAVIEANFLFGQDVCGALQEISRRGTDIEVATSMIRSSPPEDEMDYVYKIREHQRWFAHNSANSNWLRYRVSYCKFESSGAVDGSAYPMTFDLCMASQSDKRLQDLRKLSRCREGDLSCPAWSASLPN